MKINYFARIFLLIFAVALLSQCEKKDIATTAKTAVIKTIPIEISDILPNEKTGFIEGDVCYPSDYIPADMKIYAENLTTAKTYMVPLTDINDPKIVTDKTRYKIRVPEGSYNVYAMTNHMKGKEDDRAYYSEFVTCGLNVKCTSHEPITVKVSASETTTKVDPCDWYDPYSRFKRIS